MNFAEEQIQASFFLFFLLSTKSRRQLRSTKTEPFWMCRPKASVNPPTFPVMCCQRSSLRLCLYMTVQSLPVWDWRNLIQPDTLVRLCQVCFFFSFFFPVSMLLRNVCKKPFSHHSLYVPYLALKRRLLIWFSWHVLTRYFAVCDKLPRMCNIAKIFNWHVCMCIDRWTPPPEAELW